MVVSQIWVCERTQVRSHTQIWEVATATPKELKGYAKIIIIEGA